MKDKILEDIFLIDDKIENVIENTSLKLKDSCEEKEELIHELVSASRAIFRAYELYKKIF